MEDILKISTGITTFSILLLLSILSSTSFANKSKQMSAISAAESFLQLVDAGRYAESWDVTSSFFKQQVSKQQWVNRLEDLKLTLGQTIKRKIKNQNFTTSLPDAPNGEYVVIQFSTSFTNKKSAIETVTPMFESDGEWRVTGYYIQ